MKTKLSILGIKTILRMHGKLSYGINSEGLYVFSFTRGERIFLFTETEAVILRRIKLFRITPISILTPFSNKTELCMSYFLRAAFAAVLKRKMIELDEVSNLSINYN